MCTAWLAAASKSQWKVWLGSRKEQYDKHPVIYAQCKRSTQPGWRHLNGKMVCKCRHKDISSVPLIGTKTREKVQLSETAWEKASAQTQVFTNTSQSVLVSALNMR